MVCTIMHPSCIWPLEHLRPLVHAEHKDSFLVNLKYDEDHYFVKLVFPMYNKKLWRFSDKLKDYVSFY